MRQTTLAILGAVSLVGATACRGSHGESQYKQGSHGKQQDAKVDTASSRSGSHAQFRLNAKALHAQADRKIGAEYASVPAYEPHGIN